MSRKIETIKKDRVEDFMKVYKVFRDPPYCEDWSDEKIAGEYEDLSTNGYVFGYYIDNVCVGLVTFRPYRLEDEHPVHYEHSEKVMYLSDIAVLPEKRNNGIGTELMKFMLKTAKEDNFERVYMKTLEKGSMSYGIAVSLGFKQLENVTSVDTMKRTVEGRDVDDVKIYLEKKL